VLLRGSTLKKLRHYGAPLPLFEGSKDPLRTFAERTSKQATENSGGKPLARPGQSGLFENLDLERRKAWSN
jgi:hypothetical protein